MMSGPGRTIACCSLIAIGVLCATFSGHVAAAECKRKTAGFFLQFSNLEAQQQPLTLSLKSLPDTLSGQPGDPARGREILTSPQKGDCLSCHKVGALASIAGQGSVGPALDGVGGRFADGQLRQFVVDPKVYFPNTIMPSYYAPSDPSASVLTAAEVEDLVAYMKTLK
jgi:sulfur-oxidizing protein SoxX